MPQRQPRTLEAPSPYKYKSVAECEEHEDAHVVRPTAWPPKQRGNLDAVFNLRCELCGGWVVVERGHATGELPGVQVILPSPKAG